MPVAKILLAHGANVSAVDKNGQTSLHKAVDKGNLEFIQWLINSELVDVNGINAVDNNKQSSLHLACIKGLYQNNIE